MGEIVRKYIDSREVAEMMEVEHKEILRKLEGTKYADGRVKQVGIIPVLTKGNFPLSEYFLLSSYKDASGKENRCYKVTKLGCDFLANKFTGEKGIIFTARYVKRFREMEDVIQNRIPQGKELLALAVLEAEKTIQELTGENQALIEQVNVKDQIIGELKPRADYTDKILHNKGLVTITQIAKDYGMTGQEMNQKLHELGIQYKQSGQWLLYKEYQSLGYTHSETVDITRADGRPDIKMNTKWTQKGRLFIYNKLKEEEMLPIIERTG